MISKANGAEMAPFFASVEQCEDLVIRTSKSRNASPKKRGRPKDSVREADTDSSREDEHQRSRKRHQQFNSVQDLATVEETSISALSSNVPSPTTPVSF
ncbi:hypothetical protein V501_02161 [Pseudogymnoascus sp. VKM F-4519 (FW-2642)]|nr:hypothetical protein V501_02161 [Pseudogymnoascus sp. VKM F-4519 (FW-2642)]